VQESHIICQADTQLGKYGILFSSVSIEINNYSGGIKGTIIIANEYNNENYTAFNPTNCTIKNNKSFVTYVLPTCFYLCKFIIREVYTKAFKYTKFCQKCACIELNTLLFIKIAKNF
jgi:hypothetical protein